MMKRSLSTIAFVLFLAAVTFGQQWTYQGRFTSQKLITNSGIQFIVVTPDQKIWVSPYKTLNDSVWVPDSSKYKQVHGIYIFNADGTPNDTIKSIQVDAKFMPMYGSGYGLALDPDGNVLVSKYGNLYRINYQTHQGMAIYENPFSGNSMCAPAASSNGNVYICQVAGGAALKILNPDFSFNTNAVDTVSEYGRYIAVSADGNTIYAPRYSANKTFRFVRPDEFSPFVKDEILLGAAIESGCWDNVDNSKIWFSTGNLGAAPATGDFSGSNHVWMKFDPTSWARLDSINWVFATPGADERPRGIAFNNTGDAFVVEFGTSSDTTIEKFHNPAHVTGVVKENNNVVNNYSLSQNYPNPFNPTTQINFSVKQAGNVTLVVYNMLGQAVATLVNGNMGAGNYTANFDASKLASGIYIYQLNAGSTKISKKMTLMK